METLWQDFRYAIRMLRKNPGFTVVAVLTLALGIGANTAIFGVINGVLLRPLPYKDPGRLVVVWNDYGDSGQSLPAVSPPDYNDYIHRSQLVEEWGSTTGGGAQTLVMQGSTGEEVPEKIDARFVSANLLSMLGVNPMLGRNFTAAEDVLNGPNVAILSYKFWQQHFAGDPKIVGKSFRLNDKDVTVVGVLPKDFHLLVPAEAFFAKDVDVWRPQQLDYASFPRNLTLLLAFGRLKNGVTLAQAQSEMDRIAAQLRAENEVHKSSGMRIRLVPLREDIVKGVRLSLVVLMGAVGFVLLIACGNVANLLLARASTRQKEIAIRTALGAGRRRIVRQVLTEAVLLSLLGGVFGVLLAYWGTDLLLALRPANLPRVQDIHIDGTVLLFCLGACLFTGVIFGMAQALPAIRWNVVDYLKEGTKGAGGGGRHPTRKILVIAEVAMSMILLLGAGLLIRSFYLLERVRPGFDPTNVLTFQVSAPFSRYPTPASVARFEQEVEDRIAALPGVLAVGGVARPPLTGSGPQTPYAYNPETEQKWESISADWRPATPGYFSAVGIRLAAGRYFMKADDRDHPRVVIVDDTLAQQAWPHEDPIGKRLQIITFHDFTSPGIDKVYAQVVGVVVHPRIHDLSRAVRPQIYTAAAQSGFNSLTYTVKTAGNIQGLEKQIEDVVHGLDRGIPVHDVRPMDAFVADVMAPRRFSLIMVLIFGAIALTLASIGLYGVIAYSVTQRTHEMGIRMALGAGPREILGLVVGEGLALAVPGIVIGLVGGLAVTRLMSGLLFGVSATDVPTFVGGAAVVGLVAVIACYVPARRASKLHPMTALRYE
ncbi:MAG: ABC transporter permease [Candidatus Acidiferrales bacterium]